MYQMILLINKITLFIHRTIKIKPIEVRNDYYAKDPSVELHPNKKDPKFKVSDNVRISKYKKDILQIGQKFFFINKFKNTVRYSAISDLNCEEITGSFYEKEQEKTNGYVYDFSVDYDATDIHDIKDVHKYLMKKIT